MLDLVRFEANVVEETVRAPRFVRFGAFEVDLRAGELRKAGVRLKLPGQPFQVLAILLERPGEVVTREEILDTIWGPDFVAESNIVDRHVRSLRIKLQNDYRRPRFIATVPGKGYRFVPTFSNQGWDGGGDHPGASPRQARLRR